MPSDSNLNQQIWTQVALDDFRTTDEASFLSRIPDYSDNVTTGKKGNENEYLHIADLGADPEVLIDHLPSVDGAIGFAEQEDNDIPFKLNNYKTRATRIYADELRFIAYDKVRKVQGKHTKAIIKQRHKKGVHNIAPDSDGTPTPIVSTTGADNGAGRKRAVYKDLVELVRRMGDSGCPLEDLVLVMCTDHYFDFVGEMTSMQNYQGQFVNESGIRLNTVFAGCESYYYLGTPYYNQAKVKKSFGTVPVAGEYQASVIYYAPDMMRAMGHTENIHSPKETQLHADMYNMSHNYLVTRRKARAVGALISTAV